MEISSRTSYTISVLIVEGYRVTNVYNDGTARMSNGVVGVFVHEDGTITRPQNKDAMIAQARLHEAGLTIRG